VNHAETILAGIINGPRRDRLAIALTALSDEHFSDQSHRALYRTLERYYELTGYIITAKALRDLLERNNVSDDKVLTYETLYVTLENGREVEDHEFRYALDALKDMRARQLTGETLATAAEILHGEKTVGKRSFSGHRDSRDFLYATLASMDNPDAAPEGNMRSEGRDVMDEYAARKNQKHHSGLFTGIAPVDLATFGMEKGELVLVPAYTSQGKTQLVSQMAWHACVCQGKNVMFATTETSRATVRRRILARHSRQAQFNCPEGIDSAAIKHGNLDPAGERVLQEVVKDFGANPIYGVCHILQVPRGATLGFIESRLRALLQRTGVDMLVIDYLTLIKPDRPRASSREELNDVLRDTKMLAVGANDGNGIVVVSPWQIGGDKFQTAIKAGEYGLGSLSETSEAEKTPDLIMSLLRLPDAPSEAKLQLLKARDSEIPSPVTLEVDYRTSFLQPKQSAHDMAELLD
jgi:hypothetical protein